MHDDLLGGALAFNAGPELGALGRLSFGSEDGGGDGYGVWFGLDLSPRPLSPKYNLFCLEGRSPNYPLAGAVNLENLCSC